MLWRKLDRIDPQQNCERKVRDIGLKGSPIDLAQKPRRVQIWKAATLRMYLSKGQLDNAISSFGVPFFEWQAAGFTRPPFVPRQTLDRRLGNLRM